MKPKPRLVKDTGVKEAGVLILEGSQGESEILAGVRHIAVNILSKSGLVGRKIAATLASTGTISFFMHPGEAFHGDLGMIRFDEKVDCRLFWPALFHDE